MKLLAVIMTLVAVFGPFDCDTQRSQERDLAKLTEMEAQIDALIGEAKCTDGAQCKVVVFGAKPCGGPWKYKIYSKATVSTELAKYVDAYNAFNRELNSRYGFISDCGLVTPPAVMCRDGRCVAVRM
jgi:hypothetical protein